MYYGMGANGIWAIFHSLMLFALTFSRFGSHISMVRLINKVKTEDKSRLNELISKSLLIPIPILIFLISAILLFKGDMDAYLGDPNGAFLLATTMLPYTYIFVAFGILQGLHKVRQSIFIVFVLVPLLMSACIVVDQQMDLGWGALECYSIAIWLSMGVSFIMIIYYGFRPQWGKHITFKEILMVSLPMMISGSMLQVIDWTDILVLRFYEIPKR